MILVPVILLDPLLQLSRITDLLDHVVVLVRLQRHLLTTLREHAAKPLAIVRSSPAAARIEVRLITLNRIGLVWILVAETADLNARIPPLDFEIQLQFEVVDLALVPDDELVVGNRILRRRPASDRAVFDTPILILAIPAREIFPVKNRDKARIDLGFRRAPPAARLGR